MKLKKENFGPNMKGFCVMWMHRVIWSPRKKIKNFKEFY